MPGCSIAAADIEPVVITMAADYPDQVAGVVYGLDTVLARLREVGCTIIQAPDQAADNESAELPALAADDGAASLDAPVGLAAGHHASRHARHDHGRHDRSGVMLAGDPAVLAA